MSVGEIKKNILVVDDEKYICSIISEALESEKYRVFTFTDPEEALKHIESCPVDLVLTDLVMGDKSGVQILDTALANHSDAVVIIMTAHPTVQAAISVLKKGAYDFLVKPFKLEMLKSTIRRGLNHQRVIRENLSLKGQVEFLKLTQAGAVGMDIDKYLHLVVASCKKEFSARSVALIEQNPTSGEIGRTIYDGVEGSVFHEATDESTLLQFNYTRSARPIIRTGKEGRGNSSEEKVFISHPIFVRRKLHGVINVVIVNKFARVTPGQIDLLSVLSSSAGSAIANHRLYHDLQTSYLQAIRGLANAIEARDQYTAGHTDRVCRLAEHVAVHLGWDQSRIHDLIMGCTLHDIGKIGVPDSVLNKPSRLTPEEQEKMRSHPQLGLQIIRGIDLFRPAIPYISSHHEWFDGSGYPDGLAGEEIPIEGRLLAVTDTFDAIVSDRPYRKGASTEKALSELKRYKGTQFDPAIVDGFIEAVKSMKIDLKSLYPSDKDEASDSTQAVNEKAPA